MRELLPLLPKPSHYAGAEDGVRLKDRASLRLRLALAFPDLYEVGMSYLGQKILYGIANDNPAWQAERVMAPEKEAARIMRERAVPLATLETDTPLSEMDAVCFSITHELCYTDVLHMLDLAAIPLRAADRSQSLRGDPLVMAGGGAMLGAEPLAPFIDLAALGDGERMFPEILNLLERCLSEDASRKEFLLRARDIPGVYVPAFFQPGPDGALMPTHGSPKPVRRAEPDLDDLPYPVSQIGPVGAVHNRLALEIARGCTRGCRFCHAGIVYRPVRERSPDNLARILDECLDNTGFEEVSFLSLSAGDYSALKSLCASAAERCARERVSLALPSLRVGSVDGEIMERMASLRRAGCTLAPEAGSQRLRDAINKGVNEADLLEHARMLLANGWRQVKLYFMIGLPTETDEDIEAIFSLCRATRRAGGKDGPKLQVTAAISPFVPKPFTPFQWEAQIGQAETMRRVNILRDLFRKEKGLRLRWHEPSQSHLEGILSRGDRRLADVVEKAYRKGAVYCGWSEHFNLAPWLEALNECGLDAAEYTGPRVHGKPLPWSHIECGASEDFLWRERERAYASKTSPDCRGGHCLACGVCDLPGRPSPLRLGGGLSPKLAAGACAPAPPQDGKSLKNLPPSLPKIDPKLTVKARQYRIWHYKTGPQAYLSQLELQSILERAIRRGGVPVAFSQGFHPLPLVSFGRALPVGVESEAEWVSMSLREPLAAEELKERLNRRLAPGLAVHFVERVDKSGRTEQALAETFSLECADEAEAAAFADCFARFSALAEYWHERWTKKGAKKEDLRPFLLNWRFSAIPDKSSMLFTADWSGGYVSPLLLARVILEAGGVGVEAPRLRKITQIFADGRVRGRRQSG